MDAYCVKQAADMGTFVFLLDGGKIHGSQTPLEVFSLPRSATGIGSMTAFCTNIQLAKFRWQKKKIKEKAVNQKLPFQNLERTRH